MKAHAATRVAWSLWALVVAMVASSLILGAAAGVRYEFWLEGTVIDLTFATLGALIVIRQPGNRMGWLFLIPGVSGGLQFLMGQYAEAGLSGDGALPAAELAAALSPVFQIGSVLSLVYLVQLFPTGMPLSARWRVLERATGIAILFNVVLTALRPGPVEGFAPVENPLGVEPLATAFDVVSAVAGTMAVACGLAALVSLGVRFSRAHGIERLQIKSFFYACVMGVGGILLVDAVVPITGVVDSLAWTLGLAALPVGAGIAILRYRLYDIDRLINKTLVYAAVTLVLATVYFAGVLVVQSVLPVAEDSPIVVAATTLLVVAFFRPLRTRMQLLVDLRFNRRRYDAIRTVEDFSQRLRAETNLDNLSTDLVGVVRSTMQPSQVSLWLRPHSSSAAQSEAKS